MSSPPPKQSSTSSSSPSLAEEERLITGEVIQRVGIDPGTLADLFALDSIRNFGPQKFKEIHRADVTPAALLAEPETLPLKGKRAEEFRAALGAFGEENRALAHQRAVRQIVRAAENNARIVTYGDDLYPRNVFESNNPVPVLYVRGALEGLRERRGVACVGSREIRAPYDGLHYAFAETAVAEEFTVVSGFATGADRIGHEAALRRHGRTVLVMPCGLDRPFPPENKDLWEEFLRYDGATMVSEFPFGTKAAALTLRKRNKLIVAFALGVFLSQSSATGGAMNAYRFALEQHKPVATFDSDGTPGTAGNLAIAEGPPPRPGRRRKSDDTGSGNALFDESQPAVPPTTSFPLSTSNDPAPWQRWLQQLSSSI